MEKLLVKPDVKDSVAAAMILGAKVLVQFEIRTGEAAQVFGKLDQEIELQAVQNGYGQFMIQAFRTLTDMHSDKLQEFFTNTEIELTVDEWQGFRKLLNYLCAGLIIKDEELARKYNDMEVDFEPMSEEHFTMSANMAKDGLEKFMPSQLFKLIEEFMTLGYK